MGLDSSFGPFDRKAVNELVAYPHAAEKSSNFYLGFLFLSAPKRRALAAVYAYCRLIDDIVDSGSLGKEEARKMLSFWRQEIDRLYDGRPTHSIAMDLLPHLKPYQLPKQAFLEVIRGCEMDLECTRYETFEQLESYMKGVACSVGELSVRIFGLTHTPADKAAEFVKLFGYAFQLTNIIRDVGADLEMGRIYLPDSEMRQADYTREALLAREHNAAFDRLMEIEYKRARGYYQRARNLVDFRDRPALVCAEVMAHVYEGILEETKARGFRVLFEKTKIGLITKLRLAFKGWLYCYGL